MKVDVLQESGYNAALYGFSLSFKKDKSSLKDWWGRCMGCTYKPDGIMCMDGFKFGDAPRCSEWSDEKRKRQKQIQNATTANAPRDGGHNKFLESVMVWLDINASFEWWKQFDTYRVGVSKQSASTMHTLDARPIEISDFDLTEEELNIPVVDDIPIREGYNAGLLLEEYCSYLSKLPSRVKSKLLPQGYLQSRQIVLSYKVLRHIIVQRNGHKLPEWKLFIDSIYKQCKHPELLPKRENN